MITNGFSFGISDIATLDTAFPEASTYLFVSGTGGGIVYQNTNGVAQYFPGAVQGFIYPIAATKVLTSATVNGNMRTTTATNIVYCSSRKG